MTLRRLLASLVLVVLAVLVPSTSASAHAVLESVTPGAGGVSPTPVSSLELRFSEPVQVLSDTLTLVAPDGASVPVTTTTEGAVVRGSFDELEAGTYVVVWKAVSADSHPVSGTFSFSSEEESENAALDGGSLDTSVPSRSLANELAYAAMTALAAAALLVLLAPSSASSPWRKRAALVGALLGVVAAGLAVATQLRSVGLENASSALLSLFGLAHLLRLLLSVVLLALLASRKGPRFLPAVLVALLTSTVALEGHASTSALDGAVAALHATPAAAWLGGIVMALLVAPLARPFSRVAPFLVAVLILTGVVQGMALVPSWGSLSSAFGLILAVKVALVALMLVLSGLNARRVRRSEHPRRLLMAESVVGLLVVVLTGNLTATPPPAPVNGINQVVAEAGVVVQATLVRPEPGAGQATLSLDVACLPEAGCIRAEEGSPLHAAQGQYSDHQPGSFAAPPGVSARFIPEGGEPTTLTLEGALPSVRASLVLTDAPGVIEVVTRLDETRTETFRFGLPPA